MRLQDGFTKMNPRELDLYEKILKTGPFKDNNGFFFEVPIGNWSTSRKRIDMVTMKKNKIVAIEVKVNDWKTSLKQAYSNLFVSDYSYVAIWHKTLPNIDRDIFNELGIGLLEVNGSCEMKIEAKKSPYADDISKQFVKKHCETREIISCQSS